MVVSAAMLLLLVGERSNHGRLLAEARQEVWDRLDGHRLALATSMARRATVLQGVEGWLVVEGDAWEEHFRQYAPHAMEGVGGIRAVQVVRDHVIQASWPERRNEGVIGYDLRNSRQPEVSRDLARAYRTGEVTVSGPLALLQGGVGVVLRRTAGLPGDSLATSAALILDLEPLLEEAGLARPTVAGLSVHLADEGGNVFFGASPLGDDPVELTVNMPEGAWSLAGSPAEGWNSAILPQHRWFLGGGLVVTLLMGLVTWLVEGRQASLTRAVEVRTDELARTTHRLEEGEARLNAALRAGRVYVWSWDLGNDEVSRGEGMVELLGYSERLTTIDELRGRLHPDDVHALDDALADARRLGTLSVEYRVRHADGRWIWMRDVGRALGNGDTPPRRVVGATADVTRVKELEDQLVHAQKLEEVGRLAAVVAHDFNNLLTVMQANLQLGMEGVVGEALDDFRQVEWAVDHAQFLTRKLLTFSRRDVVSPEFLDFDDAVRTAVSVVRPILGSAVELRLDTDAEGRAVLMDRGQITQILFNLVANARDAMPEGGSVRISTRCEDADGGGEWAMLVVEDSGDGVPEETLATIFEPFVTTKGADKGTGLGLSTVRTIATGTAGQVWAENTEAGGARFIVRLPVATDDEGGPAAEAEPLPGGSAVPSVLRR